VGPTAVGKTAVSIGLADRFHGEIVSADSRLLYEGMDIGTDKPKASQRAIVPHHLIDVAKPNRPWSLAEYLQAAREAIDSIHERRRLPFLVGGTGQYIRGLLEGWRPPPRSADNRIREELKRFAAEHGSQALHHRLAEIDPERARSLDHRNVRRVVRALEIHRLTGIPPSELREKHPPPYTVLMLGLTLPRERLFERIDRRINRMLEEGAVAEVQALLDSGVRPDSPVLSAIGYRQIVGYLVGRITLEEALIEIRKATRQFVRRQANWFKEDDPGIEWFSAEEGVEQALTDRIREWLSAREWGSN
jgi:tRNA dimethylallyltransferase